MRYFFLLIRIYPYWALPCILVFVELAIFYRRRASRNQLYFWALSLMLLGLLCLWVLYRGDLYAERWISVIYKNLIAPRA